MFWDLVKKPSIHLIGIGGSGMSGIAEVLLSSGFRVSGSDSSSTPITERLQQLGATIFKGHNANNIGQSDCVVVSTAIPATNPECIEARIRAIPVIPRAEMLAELMRLKLGVAVAGSHGKTTTTSLLGQILKPLDPTVVVGGRIQHWNASSIVGRGSTFVIEADESDRSFLRFSPVYSIVTNIDREHLDTYKDLEDVQNTFLEFLNRTAFFGMNWISADCPSLKAIKDKVVKPIRTFGVSKYANLKIVSEKTEARRSFFTLEWNGKVLGDFELPVVGHHNVMNATAAIGIALSLHLKLEDIQKGCREFVPADRRLQIHFENKNVSVIEDYGHHPTEIAATLEALSLLYPEREKIVIFQPHRYTRTESLWKDFAPSFKHADRVFLLPIYAAHENPIEKITHIELAKTFQKPVAETFPNVPTTAELLKILKTNSREKVLLILGAGPLTALARETASQLRQTN